MPAEDTDPRPRHQLGCQAGTRALPVGPTMPSHALSSSSAPGSLEDWNWKRQIERRLVGDLSVLILSPSLSKLLGEVAQE